MRKASLMGIVAIAFAASFALALIPQPVQADYDIVYLSDNFSSYNFSRWSGVAKSYLENAYVLKVRRQIPYYPAYYYYYARFTSDSGIGSSSGEYSYCYKWLGTSQWLGYLNTRGRLRVLASGMAQNNDQINFIEIRAGSNLLAYAGWRMINNVIRWHLMVRNGPYYTYWYNPARVPILNRWYTIDLYWIMGSGGGVSLGVDGTTIMNVYGKNTAYYGRANQVRFGLPRMYGCTTTRADLDDVRVWTHIIG